MNKKIYETPSIKVINLENTDIICTSPKGFSLNEDAGDYGEDERPGVSREIWGSQW